MSWLTKIALRNRSIVGLAVVAVLMVGVFAVSSLKEELIPDLTFPYLTVFTVAPGSSATDVERNVTSPLEQAVKTTSDVKEYDSYSNEGMSIITVEYEFGTDMQAKEAEVQQAASGVQQTLPAGRPAARRRGAQLQLPAGRAARRRPRPCRREELAALLQAKVVPRLQDIDGRAGGHALGRAAAAAADQARARPRSCELGRLAARPIVTAVQQANLTAGAGTVTSGHARLPGHGDGAAPRLSPAFEELVIPPGPGGHA